MVDIDPQGSGLYTVKKGMTGHDVIAVQIALKNAKFKMPIDGEYGISTEGAVFSYQGAKGLKQDGVCGPATMETIVRAQSLRYGKRLPRGMLPSIAANESSFVLACRSPHPPPARGFDYGSFQESFGQYLLPTQQNLYNALSVPFMAKATGEKVKAQHDRYKRWGKVSNRDCWRYAVLHHNFPLAADRLAQGLSIFLDPRQQDEPADWVISASGGRLRTVREWCASYIAKATALVRW